MEAGRVVWSASADGSGVKTLLEQLHGFAVRAAGAKAAVHIIPTHEEMQIISADAAFMLVAGFPRETYFPHGYELDAKSEREGLDVILDFPRLVDILETVDVGDRVDLRLSLPRHENDALELVVEIRSADVPTLLALPVRPGALANTFTPIALADYPVLGTIPRFNAFLKRLALYSPVADITCQAGKIVAYSRSRTGDGVCVTELPHAATKQSVAPRSYNLSVLTALMTDTAKEKKPLPVAVHLGDGKPLCMAVGHLKCYIAPVDAALP